MKIKEISAGVKITKNYNSYQASLTADIEEKEIPEKVGEMLMKKALEIVNKEIGESSNEKSFGKIKNKFDKAEVGAAWLSKEFKDKLSAQYSKQGEFKSIDIKDLEKIQEGYKQKTSEGVFIFRKLSEKERKSNKMPAYRIYKTFGGENE